MEKLLTLDEVTELLGIKEKTVYKYTSLNMIPHIKIGNRLRFDYDDLMKWIKSKKINVL